MAAMTAMAALVVVLLHLLVSLSLSLSTTIFLRCGSSSPLTVSSDNPSRTFSPDESYLVSASSTQTSSSPSSPDPLYSSARIFPSTSSYSFPLPPNSYYILRLHFLPSSTSPAAARFTVSALDRYLLLSSYSPPNSTITVLEFLLWLDSSPLTLTFSPSPSPAFLNALELLPNSLLNLSQPLYLTPSSSSPINPFSPRAAQFLYRLNVGGRRITPANDTLWRTWDTDDARLVNDYLSLQNTTTSRIVYPSGLTSQIAPELLYRSARTMNTAPVNFTDFNFNLTWSFDVHPGFQYLVRLHFCNNWFPQLATFFFDVYVGGLSAEQNLNPGVETNQGMMVPFYKDFVVDSPEAGGKLNVSIGASHNSVPINALLNGLEIVKLSNSQLSLAGPSGIAAVGSGGGGGDKHLLLILLPSVLGSGLLVVLLIGGVLCHRRWRPQPAAEQKKPAPWAHYKAGTGSDTNSVFSAPSKTTTEGTAHSGSPRINFGLQISFEHIQFATGNFDEKQVIGSGGFGKVYKGVLRDGTEVAVKRGVPGRQGFSEFQTEIVVLSRIRHRHLVSLMGYCEEQSEMILVYEYMEKGTLKNYLYGSDLPCLSWKQRLEICIGAARGLHYLHTGYSQSIIHRDVKSSNILLGEDFVAKVSDFGLSRLGPSLGETHVSTAVKGTFGYFDPEYFKIQKLTDKSDIYSFGVVLFEVLCARPAIDGHVNLAELSLHWQRKGQLENIIDPRLAGSINENSLRKFGETAAKCLAEYGTERPSISDVLWNLEYALQLQETQLRREPFEDSGAVDEAQVMAVPLRRLPSASTDFSKGEETVRRDEESVVTTSMVFSQLVKGEGR